MAAEGGVSGRVLLASLSGSAIEWFDYFLYGTAASLVFSKLFFPAEDPLVGLLLAYLTFALPFFIRPLGGVLFGHIGDRIGRKKTLVLTLSLMGAGTALIGLLPTYRSVGTLAPILLITLRLIQGVGLGGEWGGAMLLVYEYAGAGRKGFFGSIPQTGVTIGMLLSTLCMSAVSLLPDRSFMSWGWRIPFLLSAGLVVLGLWVRGGIDETPDFKALQRSARTARFPIVEVLRTQYREVLVAVLAKFVETGPFYIFTVFVISYATKALGYPRFTALMAVSAGALVATLTIPLSGLLSDRIGRKATFILGSVGIAAFAVPYFLLMQHSPAGLVITTLIAMGVFWSPVTASLGTLLSELFHVEVRYTGITLGYQVGSAVAGGTAPLIATLLLGRDNSHWTAVAGYIVLTALLSIVAVWIGGTRRPRVAGALLAAKSL